MVKLTRILLAAGLFFAGLPAAFAARNLASLADDGGLRKRIATEWFVEAPAAVLARKSFITTLDNGERVEVRAMRGADDVTVILARELKGEFPGWAAGSWAYTRSKTGEPLRLRFFPRSDPYTFIQMRPFNHSKSQMDIVIYDAYITSSWPVAGSFEDILTKPLHDFIASLEGAPLRYFESRPDDYRDVRALAREIRRNIGGLRYEDDGALSEDGRYVFIKSLEPMPYAGLNCSGFSKWVVDGMLKPVTGGRLDIAALKQPAEGRGTSYTAAHEAARDPFFGLDWIRNLAAAAATAFKSPDFAALEEYEVRKAPFSSVITRSGRTSVSRFYPGFLPEAGFGIEGIGALLYTLAIDEPGHIYLGAINNDLGPRPRMRQYFHIAVFLPYFDDAGVFHVALFESAAETSFNRFRIRYPAHYINLVRIPAEGSFQP
ncbi:MAG: hypothetical protein LBD20_09860 [Spirochaetaceae bacterium]|jgi:hypothetical protein|nr:hypothetical protein [Spirochaetaceae bacterium]